MNLCFSFVESNVSLVFSIFISTPQFPTPFVFYTLHAFCCMFSMYLGHVRGKLVPPKPTIAQTFLHPYNLGPSTSIQNTHLYVQKNDTNFCTSARHAKCSHHGKNQDTCYSSKWTIHIELWLANIVVIKFVDLDESPINNLIQPWNFEICVPRVACSSRVDHQMSSPMASLMQDVIKITLSHIALLL